MQPLATLFRAILTGLQAVIAPIAAKNRDQTTLLVLIATRLNRTIQRFETLFTRWQTNTLPKQRQRQPRATPSRPTPRLPRGHAWLLRAVDHHNARACASQLQHFLATEDCAKFLAAVPRAARILRPLAHTLGLQMPGAPPPPPPKPSRTPKPRPRPSIPWPTLPPPPALYFSKTR